ncbi:MAG: ImmA/IrrE family metallo-endopeptidase [Lachnospiraceae bacterium]|nr:ImmA/IrrE family metallo-endopeptidase [Lachnospiraceae bacterium]
MRDNKELLAKLINMTGSIDGDIVFMPMISKCKGLMVGEQVEYTPEEMERLMYIAEQQGIKVRFKSFEAFDGRMAVVKDEVRIGIRAGMSFDEYVYTLAHELAHWFLHFDKGDTITSDNHQEYEEQADRAAKMLLLALSA